MTRRQIRVQLSDELLARLDSYRAALDCPGTGCAGWLGFSGLRPSDESGANRPVWPA
jgi:hypothetical protein